MSSKAQSNNAFMGIVVVIIAVLFIFIYTKTNKPKVTYQPPTVDRPYFGKKDSDLVVTEYSDFACPACGRAFPVVADLVKKYGDKVKFEYRHFPLTDLHPNAFKAAVAAECANDQNKFESYYNKLFSVNKNDSFTKDNLKNYATEVGVDVAKWQTCVDSEERDKVVKTDSREALRLGLNGTPSFLINGVFLDNWSKLETAIAEKLAK